MSKENIQNIYAQLQSLVDIDFDPIVAKRDHQSTRQQQIVRTFELMVSAEPSEVANKVCQYIEAGKMANTRGFVYSIQRMLQTGNLNKEGLAQIINTIKSKYK